MGLLEDVGSQHIEREALKEGVVAGTKPSNVARRRTRRGTEKQRHVTRELVVEGGMGAEKILTTLVGLTKSSVEECNRLREEFEEVSWLKNRCGRQSCAH